MITFRDQRPSSKSSRVDRLSEDVADRESAHSGAVATSARASLEILGRHRLAVEVGVAQLAEQFENALALVGERHDARGLALNGLEALERPEHFAQVVAVDDLGFPAEGGELAVDGVEVQDILGRPGLLEMVAIDDQGQVVEPELGGRGGGFPVLSFAELAVAGQDVGVIALLVDPGGQRVADADRESLAERAGGGLDSGQPLHVGVPLERAAQLAQSHDLVVREVAGLGERRIEDRRRVPLGEDEAVAVGPVGVLGVVPQDSAEIEGRHDLGGRQRAAGMARARLGRHLQNVCPDRFGPGQECVKVVGHSGFLLDNRVPNLTIRVPRRQEGRLVGYTVPDSPIEGPKLRR